MQTCTNCGAQNSDNTPRCNKCGVALGHQARAKVDARRSVFANSASTFIRIAVVIAVLAVAPKAYHFAFSSYYKYRLNTVTEAASKTCGGPITDSTAAYVKEQFNHCMETDELVTKAQEDYTNFTKGDKR
jgi:hypothetical protein